MAKGFDSRGIERGSLPNAEVLFASANFSYHDLRKMRAADMVGRAQELGYAGVAHMLMRPWLQAATKDVLKGEVPGIRMLREAWQLTPRLNIESLVTNAKFRVAMRPTRFGPLFPSARQVAKARQHNPVPVVMYLDPSGKVERDRRKIDILGGPGNVSVRITARFLEIARARSPDDVVNALGERGIGGVFELFESNSNSQKTGKPPAVAPEAWLEPVYRANMLDGIGFSAYRVDQKGPDPDFVQQSNSEMDALLFSNELSGRVGGQITTLQELAVSRVVVNMPYEGANAALQRRYGETQHGLIPIRTISDLQAATALTIYNRGIGNAVRPDGSM